MQVNELFVALLDGNRQFKKELHIKMEKFPDLSNFNEKLDEYHLQKMRKKVYYQILKNNQNDFFDLDLFDRKYVKNMEKSESFSKIIIAELEVLGWKTFVGYGGTGLFFYDKEKPSSAW